MNNGNATRGGLHAILREAADDAAPALIVHEASTHARITAAVVGRALAAMGLKPRYFGDSQTTGNTRRFWTTTINALPTKNDDVVVFCCITWPDWYEEEQQRARQDL